MQHALTALASARELRVGLGDRSRDHDLGAGWHLRGVVADNRVDAALAQAAQIGALGAVAAADPGAELIADRASALMPAPPMAMK